MRIEAVLFFLNVHIRVHASSRTLLLIIIITIDIGCIGLLLGGVLVVIDSRWYCGMRVHLHRRTENTLLVTRKYGRRLC